MNYCLIDENEIVEGPEFLPLNWKNISNLCSLSDAELKNIGWLPVEYPVLDFDPATQKRLNDTYNILSEKIVVIYNYRDKTAEEIAEEAEMALQPTPLNDIETVAYIKTFLKAKFGTDILFPEELR